MMPEKVLELRIPLVVAGTDCPFEDHRFDVVIQDLICVTTEVLEGIEMAPNEGIDVGGEGEDHIPHPGIAEDHAEAVQFSLPAIDIQMAALAPVDLCLDTGSGLIPENCRYRRLRSDHTEIVFDDGAFPVKSHLLNLLAGSGST